jgi:PucR C-terminal helix-turn-helix domain/GGDEF-like domain
MQRDTSRMRAPVGPKVEAISRTLLNRIDELGTRLAERIQSEEEQYRDGQVVPTADLWQSCRDNLERILMQLAGHSTTGVEAARATGRRRAEQGLPLPAILRAYRIGGRYVWETLLDQAGDDETLREALLQTAAEIWVIIDEYSEAVTDAYQETIAERARRTTQARTAVLTSLLDGNLEGGSRLWETAATLRLPHHGTFAAVAAETPTPGEEAVPGVEEALRAADVATAWRLDAALQIGVVALRPRFTIATLCDQLARLAVRRVGISEPYASLDQTPRAVRQARIACAAATPRSRELVRYEQEPVAILLASLPDASSNLTFAILGPVLALPAHDRDLLLDTLRAWFRAEGSAPAAASALHVHRNTVHYRLRRVQALTARSLSDPIAVSDLRLALEGARILDVA